MYIIYNLFIGLLVAI